MTRTNTLLDDLYAAHAAAVAAREAAEAAEDRALAVVRAEQRAQEALRS